MKTNRNVLKWWKLKLIVSTTNLVRLGLAWVWFIRWTRRIKGKCMVKYTNLMSWCREKIPLLHWITRCSNYSCTHNSGEKRMRRKCPKSKTKCQMPLHFLFSLNVKYVMIRVRCIREYKFWLSLQSCILFQSAPMEKKIWSSRIVLYSLSNYRSFSMMKWAKWRIS